MSFQFKDLQPWVDMLCDALENRGSSSSGTPDPKVYPYAQKYRDMLQQIRDKKISKYYLDIFLCQTRDEVIEVTTQRYRVEKICDALQHYFYKEFMK